MAENRTGYRTKKRWFKSFLAKWNGEHQTVYLKIEEAIKSMYDSSQGRPGGLNFSMVHLRWLYNLAYYGVLMPGDSFDSSFRVVYPYAILETGNKAPFDFDYVTDFGKGTYNYSIYVTPDRGSRTDILVR